MLNINRADVDQMVGIIEYILSNEDKVTVDKLLKECNLTFEEYRLMSVLAMPAIRRKNDLSNMRARAAYYKGVYIQAKNELDKVNEALMTAKEYLNRHFSQKPRPVIKTAEQEAAENGDCDDTSRNDEEPDNPDR